ELCHSARPMGAAVLYAALSLAAAPGIELALTSDGSANYVEVVDYDLKVELVPSAKTIKGEGRVRWKNSTAFAAPDLYWHLYLNAFRNDRSTFMKESGGKLRGDVFEPGKWGSIEVKKLAIGDEDLLEKRVFEHPDDDNDEDRTVLRTPLDHPVPPGG